MMTPHRRIYMLFAFVAVTALLQLALEAEARSASEFTDFTEDEDLKEKRDYTEEEDKEKEKEDKDNDKRDDGISKRATKEVNLEIDTYLATNYHTSHIFVSVGVSARIFHRVHYDDFAVEDNRRFYNLAAALSPAIVRVGGAGAAFLVFVPDGVNYPVPNAPRNEFKEQFGFEFWKGSLGGNNLYRHFNVTSSEWRRVHKFFKDIDWRMNFNLNNFMWKYNGDLDFSNFDLLLRFCEAEDLPFYGFQLFNEPNSYAVKYEGFYRSPEQLRDEWKQLAAHQNLSENAYFKDVLRIGPDVTSIGRHEWAYRYLEEFFQVGGHIYQDVLGLHHYYFSGRDATVEDFLDPVLMDTFGTLVTRARYLVDTYKPEMPIHMSETSNAYGGGSPLYSQSFASIFIYIDMLGQAALSGLEAVNRYTYFSGSYAMMGSDSTPTPDYWVALLHKQLIEGPVLTANVTDYDGKLRTYLSCINQDYRYDGRNAWVHGAVLTYINMNDQDVKMNMPSAWTHRQIHKFILTGEPNVDDLTMFQSPNIYLNGEILEMDSDCVPKMVGEEVQDQLFINLPRYSAGFLAVVNAQAYDCRESRLGM